MIRLDVVFRKSAGTIDGTILLDDLKEAEVMIAPREVEEAVNTEIAPLLVESIDMVALAESIVKEVGVMPMRSAAMGLLVGAPEIVLLIEVMELILLIEAICVSLLIIVKDVVVVLSRATSVLLFVESL